MPQTITIENAQSNLPLVLSRLRPGEEIVITENDRPIGKLVRQENEESTPRRPGSAKGKLVILSEDDEHLNEFSGYLP